MIPKAGLHLIAKKVATTSGDARKAIDAAVSIIQDFLTESKGSSNTAVPHTEDPLISMKHLVKYFKSTEKNYADRINSLNQAAKIILVIACEYYKVMGRVDIAELQKLSIESLLETSNLQNVVTSNNFSSLVDTLIDNGLLKKLEKQFLIVSSEDVQKAADVVLSVEFYQSARTYAKNKVKELVLI